MDWIRAIGWTALGAAVLVIEFGPMCKWLGNLDADFWPWGATQVGIWFATIVLIVYAVMQPTPPLDGYVESKAHYEAYTSFLMVGKVLVPQFHPERWTVTVRGTHEARACDVSQNQYERIVLGQNFRCK